MTRKHAIFSAALIFFTLIGMVGVAVLVPQYHDRPAAAQGPSTVMVRFIHAFPADTALDIYVDGALVVSGLAYGDSTPHLRLPTVEATVDVRVSGSSPQSSPLARELVSLSSTSRDFGQISLVIQTDNFNLPAIAKIEDLLTPTAVGNGRVHLVHAVPSLGAIDLAVSETNAPFLSSVAFNEQVGSVDPPSGLYNFVITPAGGLGTPFAALDKVHISSGYLTTILVIPSLVGSEVELHALYTPLLPDPDTESTLVQIGNGSPNAPSLDIYVDDTLVIGGLAPSELLEHTYFAAQDLTISVREVGSPPTITAAYEQNIDLTDSSQIYSLIAQGSFEDGTFEFGVFSDAFIPPNPAGTRLRVINTTSNGPVTLEIENGIDDPITVANALEPMAATDAQVLERGVYRIDGVVDDAAINGPLTLQLGPQIFVGGSYVTILVYTGDEPVLSFTTTTFTADIASLPGAIDAVALLPTATPTATITNTPLPPTSTPTAAVIIPDASGATIVSETYIVATVTLNSGINLQCREYPSPLATSLGLIPNGSYLLVLGYAGPSDPLAGEQFTPVEAGSFAAPETAISFEQIWLQIDWASPEGLVRCWVRADFARLTLVEEGSSRQILDPATLFGLATIEEPITGRIPYNSNGAVFGTVASVPIIPNLTPTPELPPASPTPDLSLIIGQIEGNANVVILVEPNVNAIPVTTLPLGATVVVLGRNGNGEWLKVRYEVVGEAASEGWLMATLISFTNVSITVNDLNVVP